MHRKFTLSLVAASILASPATGPWACSKNRGEQPNFRPGRKLYDQSAIDLSDFSQNIAKQERVLYMPFGEMAQRLGAFSFGATSTFEFDQRGEKLAQTDLYSLKVDAQGNFHSESQTPDYAMVYYEIDGQTYVRQDEGPMRQKPRREIDSNHWGEFITASIRQAIEPFRPRVHFSSPEEVNRKDRATLRYDISLSNGGDSDSAHLSTVHEKVVAPLARWRELARPLDLSGTLWVDKDTGVVVQCKLKGRLEIADRDVRPTQLTLAYDAEVQDIGNVDPLQPPKAIAEFSRQRPPTDPLGFFRSKLQ